MIGWLISAASVVFALFSVWCAVDARRLRLQTQESARRAAVAASEAYVHRIRAERIRRYRK